MTTVNTLPADQASLPSPASLDRLPYLSAVLKESFRLRPNSTPLPRVTPRDRSVRLAGIEGIPPGTRVNSFQWFVHRDPQKWADVDRWVPERWLDAEGSDRKDPEKTLWAFGSGSRMCVGTHVTQYCKSLCSFRSPFPLVLSNRILTIGILSSPFISSSAVIS